MKKYYKNTSKKTSVNRKCKKTNFAYFILDYISDDAESSIKVV